MIWTIFIVNIIVLFDKSFASDFEDNTLVVDDQSLGAQYRIHQLEARVKQLKSEEYHRKEILSKLSDQLLKFTQGGCGGILFEHWGRKTCPQNTNLVYSGYAGGSHYSHAGGSSQTLCLPQDPIMGNRPKPGSHGIVYGAEYETNFFGPLSLNEDAPCAVCISQRHTAKLMIPARNKCYTGWNEIYHGYLAANYYNNGGGAKYICMSEHPEFIFGGKANANGKAFYGVVSTCGSLRCPPYNQSVPLTCVVCGK